MGDIDYEEVLVDLERRRAELDAAISAIRLILGASAGAGSGITPRMPQVSGATGKLPSDAFFGMTVIDGAKKYLSMVKRPKKAAEITNALKQGGMLNTSANFVATVYTTLRRDAKRTGQVIQLPDKTWALAQWYPSGAKPRVAATGVSSRNGDRDDEQGQTDAAGEEPTEPAAESLPNEPEQLS